MGLGVALCDLDSCVFCFLGGLLFGLGEGFRCKSADEGERKRKFQDGSERLAIFCFPFGCSFFLGRSQKERKHCFTSKTHSTGKHSKTPNQAKASKWKGSVVVVEKG